MKTKCIKSGNVHFRYTINYNFLNLYGIPNIKFRSKFEICEIIKIKLEKHVQECWLK